MLSTLLTCHDNRVLFCVLFVYLYVYVYVFMHKRLTPASENSLIRLKLRPVASGLVRGSVPPWH